MNTRKWNEELWNPKYRCKRCTYPYDAYLWIREGKKIVGRDWKCECGYVEFIPEQVGILNDDFGSNSTPVQVDFPKLSPDGESVRVGDSASLLYSKFVLLVKGKSNVCA